MKKQIKKIVKGVLGETLSIRLAPLFRSSKEKMMVQKRRQFYMQFFDGEGDIYFDVGANYGNRIEPILMKV